MRGADVRKVISARDHHQRSGVLRQGLALFMGAIVPSFAQAAFAQAAPPDDQEPVQIRRIADADGRPVDDAPQIVGKPAINARASTFDPLEVRRIDLQAVEASIGDRSALDLSLRWIEPGLRLPAGYDQVYAENGGGFWRADGGLVARFDQSIYMSTRYGPIPDIPASTVFVIGGVPLGGEVGHGRLLAVDPLNPGDVPPLFGSVSVPDEWHSPSAVPGDRFARFGFGPGYRVPVRVNGDVPVTTDVSSRFQSDPDYRSSRLARLLSHWRNARRDESRPDGPQEHLSDVSPEHSNSEADPSSSAAEVMTLDRGS